MKDHIELRENQTIVFTGDSITDAGRDEPAYAPLGYGYVHFTANYLLAKYPELNLRIINTGISGHTINDLSARWQRDCLDHQPDIVSVLIGINDLWYKVDQNDPRKGIDAVDYRTVFDELLNKLRQQCDCQLILIDPFLFCDDNNNEMLKGLPAYIDVVHELAEKYHAVLVPLQQAIDKKIKTIEPHKWSDDTVHPYLWAHSWISQRWIEATKL